MSLSNLDRRLLSFVTDEPQTASEIWHRFANVSDHKSLTQRLRRQRRETGLRLHELAEDGWLVRGQTERFGTKIPTYSRAQRSVASPPASRGSAQSI